jgi:hypothetical protein
MKQRISIVFFVTVLITLVLIDPILGTFYPSQDPPEFFVGIDVAFNNKTKLIEKPDGLALYRMVTTDSDSYFDDSSKLDIAENWTMTLLESENSNFTETSATEKSFEVTDLDPFSILPPWLLSILEIIVPIIFIIIIVAWLITRPPKPLTTESTVKAQLIGVGNGTLKLIDNTLSFHWEKGHLRKQTKIIRKIPLTDIESVNRTENELNVTWKGVTDLYIIEEPELAGSIFEIIPQTSREQRRMYEEKEAAKQTRNELINILIVTMETIDSLFDILRSLHGWVNWHHLENLLKRSEENAKHLTDQKIGLGPLNFTELTTAIKAHQLEETSKETYRILKYLHNYFSRFTNSNDSLRQLHPNAHDTKTIILAYYLLNDIILGKIVGDIVEKEINSLEVILETLSKNTGVRIDIDNLKNSIDKLSVDYEKETVIQENRMIFKRQLEDFKIIESRRLIKHTYLPPKSSTLTRAKKFLRKVSTLAYRRLLIFRDKIRKRRNKKEQ